MFNVIKRVELRTFSLFHRVEQLLQDQRVCDVCFHEGSDLYLKISFWDTVLCDVTSCESRLVMCLTDDAAGRLGNSPAV